MLLPNDYSLTVHLDSLNGIFSPEGHCVVRRVSDLQKMFYDQQAVAEALANGDWPVYEIRYQQFITSKSDMAIAITRIFPGKVGNEYHMSKGHTHELDDQAEIYMCLSGRGYLLLDTMQGEFEAVPWQAGAVTHIPPMWAHRVVNTGEDLMVYAGIYQVRAGHDYTLVEKQGFAQVALERNGQPVLVPRAELITKML